MCVGDDERKYYKTSRVSLDKLSISHMGHGGNGSGRADSQTSSDTSDWSISTICNSCFRFSLQATEPQFQQEFLSVEIRVCPVALLEHVRLTHAPLIFSELFSPEENFLLSFLRGLAADTGEALHTDWLEYFFLSQTDQIENFFETVGEPVSWDSLLNPLWDELLQCVEDSWLRCDSFLRSAHTEHSSLGLPTILPQSVPNAQPRFPHIEARSFRSHNLTTRRALVKSRRLVRATSPLCREDHEAQAQLGFLG